MVLKVSAFCVHVYNMKTSFCICYSLFKPTDYSYANTDCKENTNAKRGIGACYNISGNKGWKMGDLRKNNTQITQYSDFNLLSVNDIFSASANGEGIEKVQSFPCVSKSSSIEGKFMDLLCNFFCANVYYNTVFLRHL